jgi:hypothetical protein
MSLAKHFVVQKNDVTTPTEIGICDKSDQGLIVPRPGEEVAWFFVSFRIFFSDDTRVRIFCLFVAQFFFPEFNMVI